MSDETLPPYKAEVVDELIPYARNARTHSDEQINKIASSIREFGFLNPVIVDGQRGIIAGHGRVLAARKIGMTSVPTVEASHLTEAQKRAYVLADNRLAEHAGWDEELLRLELGELKQDGFDIQLTGFDDSWLEGVGDFEGESGLSENYSRKIEAPVYEPKGDAPSVREIYDTSKQDELLKDIERSDVPDEVRAFLRAAATRHIRINFEQVAEFYAHADAATQRLMEASALVIVDYNQAVESGFVTLSKYLMQLEGESSGEQ